jgi:hypothetical protein
MNRTQQSIDRVLNRIEKLLSLDKFVEIDDLLRSKDPKKLSTDEMYTFLSSTMKYKTHLPYREEFYREIEGELKDRFKDDKEKLEINLKWLYDGMKGK